MPTQLHERWRQVEIQQFRMLLTMTGSQMDTTEQIWREFSERLRQFVRSRVKSSADIDDILQTVFLRIHESLDQLRSVDRMESWMFQITRNAVTDHFRKGRSVIEVHEISEIDVAEPFSEDNVNREVAKCVSALIDHLPKDQRRAVRLYELDGFSQAKIAELESISLSGAKSRIQRGRRNLEAMLHKCCRFQLDVRGNVMEYESSKGQCNAGDCGDADRCQ